MADDDLPLLGVEYHEHAAEEAGRHHARTIAEKYGALHLVEHLKTNREGLRRFLRVTVTPTAIADGAGHKLAARLTNIAWRAFVDEARTIAAELAETSGRPN